MKDRTFIEWDKDDIDALGLMKVDVLALGMLTAIKKAMDMLGIADMADIPEEDPAVYEMLCRADSVGVFQVESRAQMSMLPRLKPEGVLRPGHRGGDRAARSDPGRHGPSLPSPARRHRAGGVSRPRARARAARRAGGGARQDPGRAAVPGAGHAPGHRGGQVHARGGQRPSPVHGHLPPKRRCRASMATSSSQAWSRAATTRTSPSAASTRSRASAPTAFPRATR